MSQRDTLSNYVIIFDLDGTLVDSAPDLAAAMNIVLESEGYSSLDTAAVRPFVGHGARALLVEGFGRHGVENITDDQMTDYVDRFLAHYRVNMAATSRPFPGCETTLSHLKEEGAKLAVCTNKREELTFPLLEALDLKDYFDTIICRDTLPVYKPDPLPLLTCQERTQALQGLMVGDTTTDLNAAIAAEMPCLIAEFGYGTFTADEIEKARQFSSYEEIPGLVSEILLTRQG